MYLDPRTRRPNLNRALLAEVSENYVSEASLAERAR